MMKIAIITDKSGIIEKIWELNKLEFETQVYHCVTLDKWLCLFKFQCPYL